MPQNQKAHSSASQNVTLQPSRKVTIDRVELRQILSLLLLATPLVGGDDRPYRHHWTAIKTQRLERAKKLLRLLIIQESYSLENQND
jgi:hypothetical protein